MWQTGLTYMQRHYLSFNVLLFFSLSQLILFFLSLSLSSWQHSGGDASQSASISDRYDRKVVANTTDGLFVFQLEQLVEAVVKLIGGYLT